LARFWRAIGISERGVEPPNPPPSVRYCKHPNTSATQIKNPEDDHILSKNSSKNLKIYVPEDNIKWDSKKFDSTELVFHRIDVCDGLLTRSL